MKGLRLYLITSGILVLAYLIAQYYKPRPTNWTPTYLKGDKIPFGLYILHQQIHDLFPDAQVKIAKGRLYNTLKGNKLTNSCYLIVASSLDIDQLDLKQLLGYVNKGNHVFIATFEFGKVLSDSLKLQIGSAFNYSKKTSKPINFTDPSLKASQSYVFKKGISDQYFNRYDTARVNVLGKTNDGQPNFIKYTFGKGEIYLLPNPQLLTNYSLLDPHGADYASKALSYLPSSNELIWDEFNTNKDGSDDGSALRVIFKYEQLRWAYYLSIIGLIIFVIFEMKRRQRIIPVVDPLVNSSVEFVKVVGRVYYQQRDNRDIAEKKVNYFLEYIRSSYHLKTVVLDKELETSLCVRSGVAEGTIQDLFSIMNQIRQLQSVNDALLISFNKLTEQFYKQAQ